MHLPHVPAQHIHRMGGDGMTSSWPRTDCPVILPSLVVSGPLGGRSVDPDMAWKEGDPASTGNALFA